MHIHIRSKTEHKLSQHFFHPSDVVIALLFIVHFICIVCYCLSNEAVLIYVQCTMCMLISEHLVRCVFILKEFFSPFLLLQFLLVLFFCFVAGGLDKIESIVVEYENERKKNTMIAERPQFSETNPISIWNSWNYCYYGESV